MSECIFRGCKEKAYADDLCAGHYSVIRMIDKKNGLVPDDVKCSVCGIIASVAVQDDAKNFNMVDKICIPCQKELLNQEEEEESIVIKTNIPFIESTIDFIARQMISVPLKRALFYILKGNEAVNREENLNMAIAFLEQEKNRLRRIKPKEVDQSSED